jgi:hypothetical protein
MKSKDGSKPGVAEGIGLSTHEPDWHICSCGQTTHEEPQPPLPQQPREPAERMWLLSELPPEQ